MERQKISWRAPKLEENGGVVRKQHNLETSKARLKMDMAGSEKNRTGIRSKTCRTFTNNEIGTWNIRDIRDADCRCTKQCTKQSTCDWIIKKLRASGTTVVLRERNNTATSTLGSLSRFSGTMKVIVRYCPAFPHCGYRIALVLEQVRMVRGRG
ncbi:hypothetical protein BDP27DRAFT_1339161 [Rhodocollybia butyracea]|uniref:Uncharacterized protein n=1 Tax=Rhodocollybia butyracea TaxID=206335 RepID=A0A9P5PEJ7_9AGAR|nr:hypothetical protein BDP27DRAFT_1339161 [Rhodocollybia butyracea]